MIMFKRSFTSALLATMVLPAAAQQGMAFGQQQAEPSPSPSPSALVGNTPIPVTGATIPPNTATTERAPPIPSAQIREVQAQVGRGELGDLLRSQPTWEV